MRFFIFGLRCYQKYISIFFPRRCRFYPTCSEYTIAVLEKFGLVKGGCLALKRIIKCNPASKGGYDQVP